MLMKMRGQMQKGRNQKGFTLVELMVVVVIIGILAAIAVPVYNNVTDKANQTAHDANVRTLMGAAQMYLANDWDGAEKNANAMKTALEYNYIDGGYPVNPTDSGAYEVSIDGSGNVSVSPGIGEYSSGS